MNYDVTFIVLVIINMVTGFMILGLIIKTIANVMEPSDSKPAKSDCPLCDGKGYYIELHHTSIEGICEEQFRVCDCNKHLKY